MFHVCFFEKFIFEDYSSQFFFWKFKYFCWISHQGKTIEELHRVLSLSGQGSKRWNMCILCKINNLFVWGLSGIFQNDLWVLNRWSDKSDGKVELNEFVSCLIKNSIDKGLHWGALNQSFKILNLYEALTIFPSDSLESGKLTLQYNQ